MYKVALHPNTTLLVLALAAGLAAVIYLPQIYPDNVIEMPLIAFFAGEAGLALLLALLFYENASTEQAIRLAATIAGFTLIVGTVGNVAGSWAGSPTRMLPDSFLLVSWVQLLIMNLVGLACTLAILKLELREEFKFIVGTIVKDTSPPKVVEQDVSAREAEGTMPIAPIEAEDFVIPRTAAAESGESAKDLLDKLDVARIEALEKHLRPDKVSLEHLFGDESRAAEAAQSSGQLSAESAPNAISQDRADVGGLLSVDKNEFFEGIFAEVNPREQTEKGPKELKDFGRLTKKTLDPDTQPAGTMRTIGKMLLDVQAVENIIKSAEQGGLSTAKIISSNQGEEIGSLLEKIKSLPGVTGSLIVGHDGLVVASTLQSDMDSFAQGAMSLALFSPTNTALSKVDYGALKQMIMHSQDKTTILTGADKGILVVFADRNDPSLNNLLESLNELVH